MQLLQRFYDPLQGSIHIDGHDIKDMRISWLRQNLAVVGQEPVLFATTIEENIRYGKPDATLDEIVEAARNAGAHDFVEKLHDGYRTMVGERGCQMSGGQKQRIAIARALIQNPKILLLDEATSALDSQSEKLVQETLDRASKGRTTLVVSHRQSAIRSADRIVFIEKGRIQEDGTHEELIRLQGAYYKMMRMAHQGGEEETINMDGSSSQTDVDAMVSSNENSVITEKVVEKVLFGTENKHTQTERRSSTSSTSKTVATKTADDTADPIQVFSIFRRILIIARPEWWFMIVATIASIIIGGSFPVFSILFGEFYGALSLVDAGEALYTADVVSYTVFGLAALVGVCAFLQTYLFNKTGVNLTTRIRSAIFAAMIRQDASWYDDPSNSIGALSVRLTNDAACVQGVRITWGTLRFVMNIQRMVVVSAGNWLPDQRHHSVAVAVHDWHRGGVRVHLEDGSGVAAHCTVGRLHRSVRSQVLQLILTKRTDLINKCHATTQEQRQHGRHRSGRNRVHHESGDRGDCQHSHGGQSAAGAARLRALLRRTGPAAERADEETVDSRSRQFDGQFDSVLWLRGVTVLRRHAGGHRGYAVQECHQVRCG